MLKFGWSENVGDGDRCLRPSPEQATSLPDLAVFFSAVECFQAKKGNTPVNGKWQFMFLVMGTSTSC